MVLKEVRRDSFQDFLCGKKFPDFSQKINVDFFGQSFVDFGKLSYSASIFVTHQTRIQSLSYSSFDAG
jgi:hypothetical protein